MFEFFNLGLRNLNKHRRCGVIIECVDLYCFHYLTNLPITNVIVAPVIWRTVQTSSSDSCAAIFNGLIDSHASGVVPSRLQVVTPSTCQRNEVKAVSMKK